MLRVTRFSVLVAALEDVLVADVEVVDAGLPVVVVRTVVEFFWIITDVSSVGGEQKHARDG